MLDPYDDAQMRRFHEISWRAEKEDGRPWNSFWTFQEMAGMLREPTDDQRMECLCLYDGQQMVAAGFAEMSLLDNLDKAWVFVAVEPELRGRGFGSMLMDALLETARRNDRTQVTGMLAVPFEERHSSGLLRFMDKHGFRLANTEIMRILRLPMPAGLLEEVRRESAPYHEDYQISTFVDEVPDEYLASYCYLRNQLALDAPTGDIDFEAEALTPEIIRQRFDRNRRSGRTTYFSLAIRDGEAVAHSDLAVPPTGTESHQLGTLVRRDHRGHRLGAAVKVANLEALQRDRPDITEVHTGNAETNRWMVSINERLGFERVAVCPELLREL